MNQPLLRLSTIFLVVVGMVILVSAGTTYAEKSSYQNQIRIGQPITLFLLDSNLNLNSKQAETHSLDLIRFESNKVKTTLGPLGGAQEDFDPKPSALRETGDNTGIFYTVIKIPRSVNGQKIDFGEKIEFEYTQRGNGAKLVIQPGTYRQ